ncbi:3D domain-containing protein [Amycolatopsis sp. NPDC023774]|uniref:3D domain-containing protein n=1 Tax=Amycolatopsis sp. NPDC023774 TaxID=3155015 RepID=UPI003407C01E
MKLRALSAAVLALGALVTVPVATASAATLPACQHFYTGPIPDRPVSGGHGPGSLVGAVNVSNRLPAPAGVSGGLGGDGKVSFTFSRVPGAKAYRAFRNGQALQWISDWGQPTLQVTDASPCQNANYQLYAMTAEDNSPGSLGQISTAYRVGSSGQLAPYALAKGTTLNYRVTAYNDVAQTALGYQAGPGFCAVDARNIPWGTRISVPGYGHCYAADIGSWIKDDILDVWLPGNQADDWGVQRLTLTVE